ncbi:MAG: hypothetical protein ACRBN8_36595 [Nannocystales bacterium]
MVRPALAPLEGRRRFGLRLLGLAGCWAAAEGCDHAGSEPPHPPPEAYEKPSDFAGAWRGEVDGIAGQLRIDQLGQGRYYANFRGRKRPERYILSLTQSRAEMGEGETAPSNVCSFTWQDGRGAVGSGWLLINREDTTITGTFGRGGSMSGMGVWTFVRAGVRR